MKKKMGQRQRRKPYRFVHLKFSCVFQEPVISIVIVNFQWCALLLYYCFCYFLLQGKRGRRGKPGPKGAKGKRVRSKVNCMFRKWAKSQLEMEVVVYFRFSVCDCEWNAKSRLKVWVSPIIWGCTLMGQMVDLNVTAIIDLHNCGDERHPSSGPQVKCYQELICPVLIIQAHVIEWFWTLQNNVRADQLKFNLFDHGSWWDWIISLREGRGFRKKKSF